MSEIPGSGRGNPRFAGLPYYESQSLPTIGEIWEDVCKCRVSDSESETANGDATIICAPTSAAAKAYREADFVGI